MIVDVDKHGEFRLTEQFLVPYHDRTVRWGLGTRGFWFHRIPGKRRRKIECALWITLNESKRLETVHRDGSIAGRG